MTNDIFTTAARLRADRTPFVMATVVASYPPQSVRPGAKAIVRADGAIDGWVGGGCVQPVVRQEAAEALVDGRPRLVRMNIGTSTPDATATRHGDVREYPTTCQGEGGIEIYLEPVLAAPRLVLLGHTPVVQSLARIGSELGFEIVVGSAAVPSDLFPTGVRVTSDLGDALAGADATTWVVVGTMGAGDEAALTAAARSDAAYVGLVASRKKARHLIDYGKVGYIQIDCGRIGGIGVAKKVAEYAERREILFVNHTFTSHLSLSASLQPYAGMRAHEICEFPFASKALAGAFTANTLDRDREGYVSVPDAPGLGIAIDAQGARAYLVDVEIKAKGRTLFHSSDQF